MSGAAILSKLKDQAMLSALVKFAKSEEVATKTEALSILYTLSASTEEHKLILSKEAGLIATIKKEMRSVTSTEENRQIATNIFGELQSVVSKPEQMERRAKPKTYTLVIKGLNSESSKAELETSLLSVRGVVSFLIDLFQQKAVVRSMAPADEIIATIHSTTTMQATMADDEDVTKENSSCNSPKYLEEKKAGGTGWGWGSIISFGSKPAAPPKRGPQRPGQTDGSWWKVW